MKRLPIAILMAGAVIAAVVLLPGGGATYRVAAIFDAANGIGPGQQVKIAGAVVGTINQVQLAPGPKARILMSIHRGSGPFYADASCTILPEGLISENFVQCNPGSSRSGRLRLGGGGVPTVPLAQTTVPASFQDLLDVLSLPVDDRIRVMIDELGIATAGRGEDLNAVLERSNPALTQAQRVLSIIDAQRQQLATGIGQTNRVLAALANHSGNVRAFVDRAATVARTTAQHRGSLGGSIHDLPALLDALRPGLQSLDRAMKKGTPLLDRLKSAAPELTTSTYAFPSFVGSAVPALKSLGSAARTGQAAVRAAQPVLADLETASTQAPLFTSYLDQLLVSSRNSGAIEGLMMLFYGLANANSQYDQISHFLAGGVQLYPKCFGQSFAPGCTTTYYSGKQTVPVNDPACGPQDPAIWSPPTDCRATNVGTDIRRPKAAPRSPKPKPALTPGNSSVSSSRRSSSPPSAIPPSSTPSSSGQPSNSALSNGVLLRLLNFLVGK